MKHIAIVGLGQIGGSIVLSLRKNKAPYRITGIDTSRKRIRLLGNKLDQSSTKWDAARDSDLVILCLHFQGIIRFLKQAIADQLITDVCSGKSLILQLANQRRLRFVGGHPMTGNEFAGEKGWRENLFISAPYFLCPAKNVRPQDLKEIHKFVKWLGAKAVEIDAKKHDRSVAKTSHFPAFLSSMLENMNAPVVFHGPGFRSMVRLAKTPRDLKQTFLDSNRDNILRATKELQQQLQAFQLKAKKRRRKV